MRLDENFEFINISDQISPKSVDVKKGFSKEYRIESAIVSFEFFSIFNFEKSYEGDVAAYYNNAIDSNWNWEKDIIYIDKDVLSGYMVFLAEDSTNIIINGDR